MVYLQIQFAMHIEFDPTKSHKNRAERGLSFERAGEFDFERARIWQDTRKPYPEDRFLALGYWDHRLHVLCFAKTNDGIRVISFRKGNEREGAKHGFPLTRN